MEDSKTSSFSLKVDLDLSLRWLALVASIAPELCVSCSVVKFMLLLLSLCALWCRDFRMVLRWLMLFLWPSSRLASYQAWWLLSFLSGSISSRFSFSVWSELIWFSPCLYSKDLIEISSVHWLVSFEALNNHIL
uniref:F26F24.30 n=1 Tax=Arabidopsis thaliana TaxID=3702 RepID=Q9LR20_ARATH|nr:F26F24.30 [Arabidopsis thaliana]